jgi:light-regulated signal transduction histidine kinase (bacteriophytochrome)
VTIFRFVLSSVMEDKGHLIMLILPVVIASLRGGQGPGTFAFLFGTFLSFALYPKSIATRFDEPYERITYVIYLVTIAGIIYLGKRVHEQHANLIRKEQELAALNESLEREVAQRTAELKAANEELENFCYTMAHDMRTPTRAIAGNARILIEDFGNQLPAPLGDHLRRISRAAIKQGALVDALLTYARLAKQPIEPEPLDLTAIVYEIAPEIARREEADVSIQAMPGMMVEADARQVRTALRAILENCARYRKPGAPVRVQVEVDDHGGLVVRDDGIGFDMAFAHKVILPFERLQRDDVYPGVGMGLALVGRIMGRHDGTLGIESAPEVGTTVRLGFARPVRSDASSETSGLLSKPGRS